MASETRDRMLHEVSGWTRPTSFGGGQRLKFCVKLVSREAILVRLRRPACGGSLRGEVPLPGDRAWAFSAQPSSEPSGHLSVHWALR